MVTGAALAAPSVRRNVLFAGERGANDAIGVAVVGVRGRGQSHLRSIATTKGLRLVVLCDVDSTVLAADVRKAEAGGGKVAGFADVRKLLECKDVDAVTIATPNHWHSLIGIWACQAGKDVFIEKPVSHHLWEGRMLVEAARKHGRVVQVGTQARANPDVHEALNWLRAGNLGAARFAHGLCYNPRQSIGKFGRGEIPAGLDYDLWTGPAPLKPLTRKNLHYDWHWLYHYGNGDLGNQGIHEMDLARWFLGHKTLSSRVMSIGGRLGYDDDAETPNTQLVLHSYDGPPILFEVRGLPKDKQCQGDPALWTKSMDTPAGFSGGRTIGVIVACEGGKLIIEGGGRFLLAMDRQAKVIKRFEEKDPQRGIGWTKGDAFIFENWEAVMRSRKTADMLAPILDGHLSSALCHMGMISHRLGCASQPAEILERVRADRLALEHFESMKEHLERNGVELAKPSLVLGPSLAFDPASEQFTDNDAANKLLRRADRKPFIVPEV
jgi:predicted dehydrogenase